MHPWTEQTPDARSLLIRTHGATRPEGWVHQGNFEEGCVYCHTVSRTLNSLFKVLFKFPSLYLFAIGLGVIFSLTRSLPRTLGCTTKQPDSGKGVSKAGLPPYGPITLYGLWPLSSWTLTGIRTLEETPSKRYIPQGLYGLQFSDGLFPFHSPLLRESQLFSFPPLINMLKFGG